MAAGLGYNGYQSYNGYGRGGTSTDQRVPTLKSRSYTNTRTTTKRNLFNPISKAFDQQTLYVKKRMPARKRKQWVGFVKKVRAVNNKEKTKVNIVHTDVADVATAKNTQQTHFKLMYTGFGSTDPYKDMDYIRQALAGTTTIADGNKVAGHLHSSVLEATISNNGSVDVYVDTYYVKCHKSSQRTPDDLLTNGFQGSSASSGVISGGSVSAVGSTTLGATPFQSIDFLQHFKILKKTRTFLQAGQSIQLEERDPANHYHNFTVDTGSDGTNLKDICIAGLTQGWLFIIYGTPKYNTGDAVMDKSQAIVDNQIPITRYITYTCSNADKGAQRVAVDI